VGGRLRRVLKLCCCRCPAVRATLDEVHPSYWVKMGLDLCGADIRKRGIGRQRLSRVLLRIHTHNAQKNQRPILLYNHTVLNQP
jgi:hypothetical protein